MCGIAGAVGRLDPEVLEAVRVAGERQAHRGPDADGFWNSPPSGPGLGAAFAHRRLAIIDLSERGHQPMTDPQTGNVLCFDGKIYNFHELRRELELSGRPFETDSDSEVILKAYSAWGDACVERLRGMFAFALWDSSRRRLLLARDRVGIKPLYLAEIERPGGGRALLFASELRALLETGLIERRLDPVGLSTYLWNGFVTGPGTIVRGVRSLRAGHTAWVTESGGIVEEKCFWQALRAGDGSVSVDEVLRCLQRAVGLRLVSDVPVGVFLSGGIDSSAVAVLADRVSPDPLRTFTVCFEEAGYDESDYARRVAEAIGSKHEEIHLNQTTFKGQLDAALASLDQPTFDGINTYFVSRAVREAGVTVALSGAGGDELFGGYRSFVDIPRAAAWARRLRKTPEGLLRGLSGVAARVLGGRAGAVPQQTRWGKLGDALATRGDLLPLYQVSYALFSEEFAHRLQLFGTSEQARYGLPRARYELLDAQLADEPELHAISTLELGCFVGDRLLRDTDSTSMDVSLEVRVPLLDHEVIEAVAGLDPAVRYDPLGSKQLLRDAALGELDAKIFDRPKAGFELPLEAWTRDALHGELDASFADVERYEAIGLSSSAVGGLWQAYQAKAPGLYWSRIWSLYALLHWTKENRVGI